MKTLILLICASISLNSFSQDLLENNSIHDFQIDPLGNIFLQTQNKVIKIHELTGEKIESVFSEYGDLKKIITKNPLRIILFFEDSQTIIFLDKNLNKINMRLKLHDIQKNIISDIDSHSNLIFLLSEKSNELCIYDFKKSKITTCNANIKIHKKEYLKLFLEKETIFLINNQEIALFKNNLNFQSFKKIQNCEKIFFADNFLYLQIRDDLYKTTYPDLSNLSFVRKITTENKLFCIKRKKIFMIQNENLLEERLR